MPPSIPWPSLGDYSVAIQNPRNCFTDPELAGGRASTNRLGLPSVASGNFAVVYQIQNGTRTLAVRCFSHPVTDQQQRYDILSQHLRRFWHRCSKVLPSQVRYCAYCGVGVSLPPQPGLGRRALPVLGCVLLLVVGLMVGRWTPPHYPSAPDSTRLTAAQRDLLQQQEAVKQTQTRMQEEKQQLARDKQELEAERQRLTEERRQFEADRSRDKTAEAGGGKAAPITPPAQPPAGKEWKNSTGMECVLISAGEFMMGSNNYDDKKPVYSATPPFLRSAGDPR